MVSAGLVEMAGALLNWVLWGISWSYTKGGIVEIGWSLTRDLVNIIFILAMVIIGLATALRIEGYQVKKTLPTLIIIALLINFTPVICGFIVDASNIVMNFFVSELSGGAYWQAHLAAQRLQLPASIWEGLNPFVAWEKFLGGLTLVFTDLIVFFILLIYALLFFLRYVAIWMLVILSPFAFACYILPATRGFFETWWKQFTQWCIIGIFGAFFLYLGEQMFGKMNELKTPPQGFVGPGDMLINLMPLFAIIAFYVIGFFMALSTSAIGATYITSGGKAAGKVAGSRAWKGLTETVKTGGRAAMALDAGAIRGLKAYQIVRSRGFSRRQAFVAAAERGWREATIPQRRAFPIRAAAKGIGSAFKDTGEAFFRTTFKAPKKKKGQNLCGSCGGVAPAGASFCPHCGTPI